MRVQSGHALHDDSVGLAADTAACGVTLISDASSIQTGHETRDGPPPCVDGGGHLQSRSLRGRFVRRVWRKRGALDTLVSAGFALHACEPTA